MRLKRPSSIDANIFDSKWKSKIYFPLRNAFKLHPWFHFALKKIYLCNSDVRIKWNPSPLHCSLGKWCDCVKKHINFPFSIVNSFNIIQRFLVHMSEFHSIFFAFRFTVLALGRFRYEIPSAALDIYLIAVVVDFRHLMMMAMHLMFVVHFQFTSNSRFSGYLISLWKLMPEPVNRHFWPA